MDYHALPRITADDSGLPDRITKWCSRRRLPRVTPDEPGLPWITLDYSGLHRINADYSDYRGLLRLTSLDHQVVQPFIRVFFSSRLWRITRDYVGLSQITLITPNYSDLLRITADYSNYPGLPVWISKWSSGRGLSSITLDEPGLPLITLDYFELHRITAIYSDYCGLL